MKRGNVELGMSILPLNLIFQVVLLPAYLSVFIGSEVRMDVGNFLWHVAFVLVIPFLASVVTKWLTKIKEGFQTFILEQGDPLQLLFLCLAAMVMYAQEVKNLLDNPMLLVELFIALMIFWG
ncbi:hypothetical protein AAC978_10630 [Desulfitobacterium sp. THU1]|uniref:arsenic resistance protein n=1 Tax=Desulfitobacterium sp. THU1 TaxID=3138072 RepID=UPI00311DC722